MNKSQEQSKMPALILILLALAGSYFFLLQPAFSERSALQQQAISQESSLQDNTASFLSDKSQELNITVVNVSSNRALLKSTQKKVLSLALAMQKEGQDIRITKKGSSYIIVW